MTLSLRIAATNVAIKIAAKKTADKTGLCFVTLESVDLSNLLYRSTARRVTNPRTSRKGSQYIFRKNMLIGSTYPQTLENIFMKIKRVIKIAPKRKPGAILRGAGCSLAMKPLKIPKSMKITGKEINITNNGICWYQVGLETTTYGDFGVAGKLIVCARIVPITDKVNIKFQEKRMLDLISPTRFGWNNEIKSHNRESKLTKIMISW
jgi:hypothetical protein